MSLGQPYLILPASSRHPAWHSGGMDDPAATLRRWEDAGGTWQVLSRGEHGVVVSLRRCDGGEEAERVSGDDPGLLDFLGDRETSED